MYRLFLVVIILITLPLCLFGQKDINSINSSGYTPLIEAVRMKNIPQIQSLLERGVKLDTLDTQSGLTALHWACKGNAFTREGWEDASYDTPEAREVSAQIAKMLIEAGTSINVVDRGGKTALMYAVQIPENSITKMLLDFNPDVQVVDSSGNTALHYARDHSQQLLLQAGALPNIKNKNGNTPFLIACEDGSVKIETIRMYLEKGADIHARNARGRTAFISQAYANPPQVAVLQELLRAGADINAQDNEGNSALHGAIYMDLLMFPVVELLIQAKMNVNLKNKAGDNALNMLANSGKNPISADGRSMVDMLIAAGVDVNAANNEGNTALILFVKSYHYDPEDPKPIPGEAFYKLLQAGADANLKNKEGQIALDFAYNPNFEWANTAEGYSAILSRTKDIGPMNPQVPQLWWAIYIGNVELAKAMILKGADVNYFLGNKYTDANYSMTVAADAGNIEIIKLLLDKGAKVNVFGLMYGNSPLKYAVNKGRADVVKLLLEAKADPNARGPKGMYSTPLSMAVAGGFIDIVKLLLAAKANVNASIENGTILEYSMGGESTEMLQLLLDAKADVNPKGTSPLFYAIGTGNPKVVEMLIKYKAKVQVKNAEGQTALAVAQASGNQAIIAALVKAGAK